MLLVAVTGPVGSAKTSTLAGFARSFPGTARPEGFVAVAHGRPGAGHGAASYTLDMLADGRRLPYATRAEEGYVTDPQTERELDAWAARLPAGCDVVVLDEFGKWEAEGRGHFRHWAKVEASRPKLVVVGVRESALPGIEARLGRKFDLVLRAGEGDAAAKLLEVATQRPDWERVGKFGAGAGALEMTVGAALHTAHFPFTGVAMSTAQAAVLTVAGDGLARRQRVAWVALIAAGLKALSPSGKRLGPMLAISMQGLLFTLSTTLAGWNGAGVFLGGALMGAWASSQGFLVQYLMLGGAMEKAYNEAVRWLAPRLALQLPSLMVLVLAVVALNALSAGVAALAFWRRRGRLRPRVEGWMEQRSAPIETVRRNKPLWLASLFLPTVLVAGILASTGTRWAEIALVAGRSAGVAALLFAVVQRWNPQKLLGLLRSRGHWGPAYALGSAIDSKRKP